MTVTYTAEVATCKKFGCFIKLLARWRGSIYKIIWMDLLLFLALYYCINLVYFFLLENEAKETFESIVNYCASYTSLIPLSFVLGFYVNLVMSRWWEQYITIPWPDSIAVFVSAYVHGQDEGGRLMRRTVMRYVCLCLTIVFTMISPCVKKRFPKMKNLVDAGLLLENEKQIFEAMDASFPKYPKHWMPIVWAASIITRARKEGRIRDDFAVKTIIDELNNFRGRCGTLMYYDFISIPLVYTQVVTIAVYSFFVCSLLAHQWTDKKTDTYQVLDFYSPVFITLQFFFYMGWLKVAETLINPFGEDDDDFEVNWMIDRNLQVSYLIVDEMHHEHPELVRDQYWDEVYPNELPYDDEAKREQPPEPSTAKYDLEDLSKRTTSRLSSIARSVIMVGKSHSSIQSALNQRSQRFNEAFQRFLNYTEGDASSLRSDVENSLESVSEIENIEHIISYIHSDQAEFDSQVENTHIKETPILEPIIEENEELSEAVEEEEMLDIEEEEEGKIETHSSHESDSDSDPFERLRIERQEQRLQNMNNYLERHFGTNFRIVQQLPAALETKSKTKSGEFAFYRKQAPLGENSEEEETLNGLENYKNLDTPTNSTHYINLNLNVNSAESLIETDEKLLTSKISSVISKQKSSSESLIKQTTNENMLQDKTSKSLSANETLASSNLSENNFLFKSLLMTENKNENANSHAELQENILKNNSVTSTKAVSMEQGSLLFTQQVHFTEEIPSYSRNIFQNSEASEQNKSNDIILIPQTEFTNVEENITITSTVPVNPFEPWSLGLDTQPEQGSRPLAPSYSNVNISQDISSSSMIINQSSILFPHIQSSYISLQDKDKSTESLQAVKSTSVEVQNSVSSNSEKNSNFSNEPDLLKKSKPTSHLGSARSLSTQSSLVDDWEIPASGSSFLTKEYRVEIEGSKDENNDE